MRSRGAFARNLSQVVEGLLSPVQRKGAGTAFAAGHAVRHHTFARKSRPATLELIVRGLGVSGVQGSFLEVSARVDGVEVRDPRQIEAPTGSGMDIVAEWDLTEAVTALYAVEMAYPGHNVLNSYVNVMDDFVLSLQRHATGDLGMEMRVPNPVVHALIGAGHLENTDTNRYRVTDDGLRAYLDIFHLAAEAGLIEQEELYKRLEFLEGTLEPRGASQNWAFENLPYLVDFEPVFKEARTRIVTMSRERVMEPESAAGLAM
ncbi:hypothetical protein [Salipiger sp. PrR003]|uniref:hypothetical protein n=1 Tax=Salipiger sp. PrR003 TaxID=2706776 RepID=UPI0013DBDE2B|nr:hypothetical protein [Salipiger sp. PrR003]NDV52816.1 hypothetical protein [Salipiger sp. PrR003]